MFLLLFIRKLQLFQRLHDHGIMQILSPLLIFNQQVADNAVHNGLVHMVIKVINILVQTLLSLPTDAPLQYYCANAPGIHFG